MRPRLNLNSTLAMRLLVKTNNYEAFYDGPRSISTKFSSFGMDRYIAKNKSVAKNGSSKHFFANHILKSSVSCLFNLISRRY